jgi:hypothetical protein
MFRVALAALTLLSLLAAVAAAPRSVRTTESRTFDHATTETKRFDLRVPGPEAHARLRFKGVVRSGEIRARLLDPSGVERQSFKFTPDGARPSRFDFEGGELRDAGAWTFEVELKGATGGYEFNWSVD